MFRRPHRSVFLRQPVPYANRVWFASARAPTHDGTHTASEDGQGLASSDDVLVPTVGSRKRAYISGICLTVYRSVVAPSNWTFESRNVSCRRAGRAREGEKCTSSHLGPDPMLPLVDIGEADAAYSSELSALTCSYKPCTSVGLFVSRTLHRRCFPTCINGAVKSFCPDVRDGRWRLPHSQC